MMEAIYLDSRPFDDWQAMVMSPGVELEENHRSKKGEKVQLTACPSF